MELKVDQAYFVNHTRKGCFDIMVTEITNVWVTGVIIDKSTTALVPGNERYKGDTISIRKSLASFKPIDVTGD